MRTVFCLALLVSACATPTSGPKIPEGKVAFRFRALDGQARSLAEVRGRPVAVLVITTWSDLALLEVARFGHAQKQFSDKISTFAVVLDEDPRMAEIFQQTYKPPYEVLRVDDPARFTGPDGPFGPIGIIPTSVLLNREGVIAIRSDGVWPEGALFRALSELAGDPKGK